MIDIKASGNPLAPTITWLPPDQKSIPQGFKLIYAVRLLKDFQNQFYRSKGRISETKHQIPEGVLKTEDFSDTYVRIECWGFDTDDPGPRFLTLEYRSETIRPLNEVWVK